MPKLKRFKVQAQEKFSETPKAKEYAGAFPVSTFQSMLRNTDSFSQVKIDHVDQYTLDYVCTPKPVIELSDEFLKKLNLIAKKTNNISSIRFDKPDNSVHFTFTDRSFI